MSNYQVVVIGGGPAGIMAAARAAENGKQVLLLEKNNQLGKKILITGKGRCNLTQAEFDLRTLVQAYRTGGKFLFSAFNAFGPKAVVDFFTSQGLDIKVERGGRVFPVSDDARDVVKTLEHYLRSVGVEVRLGVGVKKISLNNNIVQAVVLSDGEKIIPEKVVVATGGLSYPLTGSTGDGLKWANELGHTIEKTIPALVPLKIKESWVKSLQGLSLKNVELTAWQNKKKIASRFGEMLFTHFGVSGPIVLDMSKDVILARENGAVELSLNLKPALSREQLDERIQRDFKKYQNKLFKNSLDELLPQKFISVMIDLSGIDPLKSVNSITKLERKKLVDCLSDLRFTVIGDMGYDVAIVTSGGVNTKEIDPRTMQSKKIDNLYFAGEMIDVDGPTGGYNLQVAWATGYLAGESVSKI